MIRLMKVALIDLDMMADKRRRAFPNLSLMKLSAWHKKQGDDVSLNFPLNGTDKIYASCVFTWHRPKEFSPEIEYGGGGINNCWLPLKIEHIMPDYDLYPNTRFSCGYTSRGCFRDCPFCKVSWKEGSIQAWAHPSEFYDPRFSLLVLLDNNIFGASNWKETCSWLADKYVKTDINQGMDIRLIDDEKVYYLKQMNMDKWRFAFDDITYEDKIRQGLELILSSGVSPRKLAFYVLTGYKPDDGAVERMKLLQSYGVDVYPMIYKGDDGKEPRVTYDFGETLKFHGPRGNLRKFLRITGRI